MLAGVKSWVGASQLLSFAAVLVFLNVALAAPWQPKESPLATRWAQDVTPENVHAEYPRPQLVRDKWLNLNGVWDFTVRPALDRAQPGAFDQRILVPFPPEAALSGVMAHVDNQRLWYRRTFTVPQAWAGQRVLLHFGAVDWDTTVWVNDVQVGEHKGGYDPFFLDVTEAVKGEGQQTLTLSVWDPSDAWTQPRGKQVLRPEGIWYTPSSGVWQTVWLEPVPQTYLTGLRLEPDIDVGVLRVRADTVGQGKLTVQVSVKDGKKLVAERLGAAGEVLTLAIPEAKLWSPDTPFLYDLSVRLLQSGKVLDQVTSYAGMRKISLGQDDAGVTRLFLNNQPLFQFGVLDQGFWPDGLYTAPTDAALRYDLEAAKKLGFNTVRKHVKVEPARWYYWADRLGLLVWQDMPSGDALLGPGEGQLNRTKDSAAQFELELKRLLDTHMNHPSIVLWVLFNEGWGQYDTARLTNWVKLYDGSRLVNSVSGWNDVGVGDIHDVHNYPDPLAPPQEPGRAAVLGEFGGLGLPVVGHTWQDRANWGYQEYKNADELSGAYRAMLETVRTLSESQGLAAAIYTQLTDVETEVNGLLTYDRTQFKLPQTPTLLERKTQKTEVKR